MPHRPLPKHWSFSLLGHLGLSVLIMMVAGFLISQGSSVPPSQAAFGTSPPWVKNDHLLPGTTYEQIVNLSRNDPDSDMKVNVRITGDKEISNWLKIEDQNHLIMKKGENILPMNVIVTIPPKAALRDYKGGIFVTLEPIQEGSQEGGTVAITLGANIAVQLSVVGTPVVNYRIQSISLNPMTQGQSLSLTVELENMGNTEVTSLNGQVDIYDEKETQVLKSLPFGNLSTAISPDETSKAQVAFDNFTLDPGNYWVVVRVYKGKESIYENRLYQQVLAAKPAAVATSESTTSVPSLPKIPTLAEQTPAEATATATETPVPETNALKPAATSASAPASTASPVASPESRLLLIFGLIGLGFGLIALIGVIGVLIMVVRNQRQANLERYLASQIKNSNPNP
jgi:hypothetical protein